MSALAPGEPLLLTLYGRTWCHLCEDMRAALDELIGALHADGAMTDAVGVQVDVIDIDADPLLQARYDEQVPVLVLDGVELCHHRLDYRRVADALLARRRGAKCPNPA